MQDFNQIREQILQWVAQDEDRIVDFLSSLVRCKTANPPGDTREAMDYVQRFLASERLSFEEVNARDDWPNLISSVEMPAPGRHVMYNGHLDVFPADGQPGWTYDPWGGTVAGGRVWGRGTGDMKCGLTASIFAYVYLSRLREQLKGKVSLTVVSDEESGGLLGAGYMFDKIEDRMIADCVISGESTTPRAISFGGKGMVQMTINVWTPGAHASAPQKSANAIRIAMDIARDLDALKDIRPELPASLADVLQSPAVLEHLGGYAQYMSQTTLNVGTIEGGSKVNVIPSNCRFEYEARIPIGVDPESIVAKAKEIVARYPEASIDTIFVMPPDYSDPNDELARTLQDAAEGLGLPRPIMVPSPAQSDCRFWRDRGIPAFWYGPTPVAGTPNESIAIEELITLVKVHALAAARYLTA